MIRSSKHHPLQMVFLSAIIILALLILPASGASADSQVFVGMPAEETLSKTYDGETVDLLPQSIILQGEDITAGDVELSVLQYALYDTYREGDCEEAFLGVIGTADADGFSAALDELPDIRAPGVYYAVYSISGLAETYEVQFTVSLPAADDIFLSMPTGEELSQEYDGEGLDFSLFFYDISPQATLWSLDVADEAAGLVLLDIYYWDTAEGDYVLYSSLVMGNMTAQGYLPNAQAYADISSPGQYRAEWSAPLFGTNTYSDYIYHYVSYSVDFWLDAPQGTEEPIQQVKPLQTGLPVSPLLGEVLPEPFLTVPTLDKAYDGNPVDFGTGLTADYSKLNPANLYVYLEVYDEGQDIQYENYIGYIEQDNSFVDYIYSGETPNITETGRYQAVYTISNSAGTGVSHTINFRISEPLPEPFLTVPTLSKVYDGDPVNFTDGLTVDYSKLENYYVYLTLYDGTGYKLDEAYIGYIDTDNSCLVYNGGLQEVKEVGTYQAEYGVKTGPGPNDEDWTYHTVYFEITAPVVDEEPIIYDDKDFKYALINSSKEDLPDDESIIFVILGDGFTDSAEDQAKFNDYAKSLADYLQDISPLSEYADHMKTYRVNVISAESGVSFDSNNPPSPGAQLDVNNYFGSQFWMGGMERLAGLATSTGAELLNDTVEEYVPEYDFAILLLNSERYGGAGGEELNNIPTISLNSNFLDMCLHEMAHSIANLSDEYYSGDSYAALCDNDPLHYPNMIHKNYENNVPYPWSRFLGKDGVGLYAFDEGGDSANYRRSHQACRMRYLGSDAAYNGGTETYPFCQVCKEALRNHLAAAYNQPMLAFQPYADDYYANIPFTLDDKHIILRTGEAVGSTNPPAMIFGENMASGDLTFTITGPDNVKIAENATVDTAITAATPGKHTIEITYSGSYGNLTCTGSFTVLPMSIVPSIDTNGLNKQWDRKPVALPTLVINSENMDFLGITNLVIEYSWHKDNGSGGAGEQVGDTGVYEQTTIPGPSLPGKYVLKLHIYDDVLDGFEEYCYAKFTISLYQQLLQPAGSIIGFDAEELGYLAKPITILGDGFSDADYEDFLDAANDVIRAIMGSEPFVEMPYLFQYYVVATLSEESGISKPGSDKDTYFGFSLDASGNIINDSATHPIYYDVMLDHTYYLTNAQYGSSIVILNDDSSDTIYNYRTGDYKRSGHIITMADPEYKKLISDLANQYSKWDVGSHDVSEIFTEWMGDAAKTAAIYQGLNNNMPYSTYALIRGQAYKKDYYLGQSYDLRSTFTPYVLGTPNAKKLLPALTAYTPSYFADNNGFVGSSLSGVPTRPGTYWVQCKLGGGDYSMEGGGTFSSTTSRGITRYTLKSMLLNAGNISKVWDGQPVSAPSMSFDWQNAGYSSLGSLQITLSWHEDNGNGQPGTQIGTSWTYGNGEQEGPSAVGKYVLKVHIANQQGVTPAYNETVNKPFAILDAPKSVIVSVSNMNKIFDYAQVKVPQIVNNPALGGFNNSSEYVIELSWHKDDGHGQPAEQIGVSGIYGQNVPLGPSAIGNYVLKIRVYAVNAGKQYEIVEYHTFSISAPPADPKDNRGDRGNGGGSGSSGVAAQTPNPETSTTMQNANVPSYNDVATSDWFYSAIQYVVKNNYFKGVGNDMFMPNMLTTRGMQTTIIWRIAGEPSAMNSIFSDVPEGQWYSVAAAWAAANDIMQGYGDGTFGVNDPVSREQMAVIFYRFAQYLGIDTSSRTSLEGFGDGKSVSSWAQEAMEWAVEVGLFQGKGGNILDPGGYATRAEVATLIMRFMEDVATQK